MSLRSALILLSLVACAEPALDQTSVPSPDLPTLAVTINGTQLVDAAGRTVILHGVDAGGQSKKPPYFPFAFAESGIAGEESAPPFAQAVDDFADIVQGWGINLVRLLFLWEAVEPTQGTYDDVYLGRVVAFAQALGSRGIRVVLDNHQDVYATVFCGEGFPLWTLNGYSANPPSSCDPWYQGYLGEVPDMSAAFDRLWANTGGLQDELVAMWQHVAAQFVNEPEVIAFEIINEPYFGTSTEATWAAGPLKTFYETVGTAIRQEVPNALLVFEPTGAGGGTGTIESVPPSGSGWIFGPHYYEPETFVLGPDLSNAWTNMTQLVQPFAAIGTQWNLPVYMGEFGVGNSYMNSANYLEASWDAWDTYSLSASVWHFSTTPDFGTEQMDIWKDGGATPGADACVRPYVSAVAGTLQSFSFTAATGVAVVSVDATPGGVTELVVPTLRYPHGPSLKRTGARVHYEYDASEQRLRFTVPLGGQVTLTLSP